MDFTKLSGINSALKIHLIYCLILLNSLLYAQRREIKFEHFDNTNGLSNNAVHCIIQDDKGFLWIGTEDGLNRFDGYSIISYKKDTADPFSISDNYVNSLYLDKKNNLWIGTNSNGLNRYDKYNDRFVRVNTIEFRGKSLPIKMINAITEDSDGHLWLGTYSGLIEFDPVTEKILSHYTSSLSDNALTDNEIRSLFMDPNDVLWIGTNRGGLIKFDIRKKTFNNFKKNVKLKSGISDNSVSSILRDKSGNICIGTSWGFNILDEKTGNFSVYYNNPADPNSLSDNVIFSVYEDHLSNIWLGTLNGLNLFDKAKNRFYSWRTIPSVSPTIIDNYVFSIFEDKYGQMWLGTATKGLSKFNNQLKKFMHFYLDIGITKGNLNNTIREIYQDNNGLIWIGVLNGGLHLYNQNYQYLKSFRHEPGNPNSISDNRVNCILKDSKSNVWIGTWDGGLNKIETKNGKISYKLYTSQSDQSEKLPSNIIQEIKEDRWGRLWIGTENGLALFDTENEKIYNYENKTDNPNSLVNNSIQSGCIIFDKSDNLWIGSWGGITRIILSPVTHLPVKFIQYKRSESSLYNLSENRIVSLYLDKKNTLWAGTFGGGLNKITLDSYGEVKSIKNYTETDGLPNNVIYGILEDKNGFLWLSTNNGLSKFNPENGSFENYDENDGLQSNLFYWGAACRFKTGEFAFGGINGYNVFNPDSIQSNKLVPDIVITEFKIFNKKVPISPGSKLNMNIVYADQINLDYDDKVISFEFSALEFSEPIKNNYAYMLDGFDKDWNYTDAKKRFAVYTNLEHGQYLFKVKGTNADGTWSTKITEISVIVHPPVWKTWWFRLTIILLAAFSMVAFYRWRLSNLQNQKRQLERAVMGKTAKVVAQNEELHAVNDELTATNEELDNQKEELKATLAFLEETQKHLVESEKMASIGVLAAGVAHEINNPLNFIHGGILGLETYFKEKLSEHIPEVSTLIQGIHEGVRRASNIVTSLNHYSRRDDLSKSNCDIHIIIDNCLTMLQNETKHRIEIKKNYCNDSFVIFGNESKLHQVLLNILVNSIQAIEGNGIILITTWLKERYLHISINDNGIGIKSEHISKIFDPFFTTKEPGKGTGLGMSISYNIIREHGGKIEVHSEYGIGSTILLLLPVSNQKE